MRTTNMFCYCEARQAAACTVEVRGCARAHTGLALFMPCCATAREKRFAASPGVAALLGSRACARPLCFDNRETRMARGDERMGWGRYAPRWPRARSASLFVTAGRERHSFCVLQIIGSAKPNVRFQLLIWKEGRFFRDMDLTFGFGVLL